MISLELHIISEMYEPTKYLRDWWFTTVAMPTASLVVTTFWGVWFVIGPDFILPEFIRPFFPDWINHSVHTVPLIINIILMVLIPHKYPNNGYLVTLGYEVFYIGMLYFVKRDTGFFPYPYLDSMNGYQRVIYFIVKGAILMASYNLNRFITQSIHGLN